MLPSKIYTLVNQKYTHSTIKNIHTHRPKNGTNMLPSTGKTRENNGAYTHSSTVYTLINKITVHIHSHQQIHTYQQYNGAEMLPSKMYTRINKTTVYICSHQQRKRGKTTVHIQTHQQCTHS